MKRVYIDVTLKQDKYGVITPLSVIWEDGRKYGVDRVLDIRKAAATKAGGCGTRYTIRVLGRVTYLFNDGERWFVEAKN